MNNLTILSKLELYSAIQTIKKDSSIVNMLIKWRLTDTELTEKAKQDIETELSDYSIDELKFISPIYEKIEINSFYPYSIKGYGVFYNYYVMLTIQHHESTPEIYNYEIILFDCYKPCVDTFEEYF